MVWEITKNGDPAVGRLADAHYSRKTRGALLFTGPGRVLVLYVRGPEWPFRAWAGWVWWSGVRMDAYTGWWNCSLFRNESPFLSSDLIREAVEVARDEWGEPPYGFDTYVWPSKLRSTNPGYCYQMAGWLRDGWSKDNKKQRLYLAK